MRLLFDVICFEKSKFQHCWQLLVEYSVMSPAEICFRKKNYVSRNGFHVVEAKLVGEEIILIA